MTSIDSPGRRKFVIGSAFLAGGVTLFGGGQSLAASSNVISIGQSYDAGRPELALINRVQQGFFASVNEGGGVRGRKIRLLALDDGGDVEQQRRNLRELADREQVLALFGMPRSALVEAEAIPQLFVHDRIALASTSAAGRATVDFYPNHGIEGALIARYIAARDKVTRVAVLHSDDLQGRQYLAGIRWYAESRGGLQLVAASPIATGGRSHSTRMWNDNGADTVIVVAPPAATVAALAAIRDAGWRARCIIDSGSAQALRVAPAVERTKFDGVESVRYFKDAHDPAWAKRTRWRFEEFSPWDNDRGIQAYTRLLRRYAPGADSKAEPVQYAYTTAQLTMQVLRQCRDTLTRANVLRQSLRLGGVDLPLLSPGIRAYTHPTRRSPITQGQFMRFDGESWNQFGEVIDLEE